jgi:hypothetical protein
MQDLASEVPRTPIPRTPVNRPSICFAFIANSSPLLHCEQRSLRQRKVARLAYDSNHAKLWQDIKADLDKLRARAGKFAADAEWAFGSRTARVLGVLVLFAVVVTLLWVFLNWYVAPTKPSDKKDLVLALAQILAGTALLSGLYFTWRTLQVNREGQITERFTRAIDQLGKVEDGQKLFEIRLGGIYALERIARESAEDHWPIMEVLTAYVRQNAPLRTESDDGTSAPDPDVQAIMTVLRRRARFFGHGEPDFLDLGRTHLGEANLQEANLQGAKLWGAHLKGAKLWGAKLQKVILREANLYAANLYAANLQGAHLIGANLIGAHLREASVQIANFPEFYIPEANLRGANVTDEQLASCKRLVGAIMPDGQKYDDWLKAKEGSGKDVEDE